MTVSSVTTRSSAYATSAIDSTSSTSDPTGVESDFDAGQPPQVSKMADLMSQLQELEQSDPDKFKKAMEEISNKLKAEANGAIGEQADRLNALADKFSQAGQSGDLAVLKPPAHAGHKNHGGHGTYAAAASQQQQPPGDDLAQIIQGALDDISAAA